MKHLRRIASLLLAVVLVLALSVGAFADDDPVAPTPTGNSITVTNAQKGETYKIYKMLDLSVNTEMTAYSYTVNSAWNGFFTGSGAGAAYVKIDANGYVTWKSDKGDADSMIAFGKAAAAYAAATTGVTALQTKTPTADETVSFTGLDSGYYLVTSTNGSLAITDTTPTTPAQTVAEKNADATVAKTVEEDSTGAYGAGNDADITQTVNFKTTISAKKGATNYVLHDKMDAGLTLDAATIAVKVGTTPLTKDTDYTVSVATTNSPLTDGCTFEINFTQTYLDSLTADTSIEVTYSATLNAGAVVGSTGNLNKTMLSWGDASKTEWASTTTKTWELKVFKYAWAKEEGTETDPDTGKPVVTDVKKPLSGAEFKLYKEEVSGQTTVKKYVTVASNKVTGWTETKADGTTFTTPATGKFTIEGLDSDTYYLEEITAPAGYNLLEGPIKVVIEDDGDVYYWNCTKMENGVPQYSTDDSAKLTATDHEVPVENKSGVELPSTGGMGTTMFYVLGSVLALGAVVLLVTRKRMSKNH